MPSQKVIFIVGPTAVGKSDLALELAKHFTSQIVSCDSVQVYREINIASNKPSKEILNNVPHHLVNIISVKDRFDVSQFYQLANTAIEKILVSKELPLVVGGSGLYVKILLDGIFKGANPDLELREQLRAEAEQFGNEHIYRQLQVMDPVSAGKIHPNDVKKIIRALEVCLLEGLPISDKQQQREGIGSKYDITIIGFNSRRELLYGRINQRVDDMFDAGLIEEIRSLNGADLSPSAAGIIGIKEVRAYLRGECDLETAKNMMKQNTRRFAKRQLTWFRKEKRVHWIDIAPETKKLNIINQMKELAGL